MIVDDIAETREQLRKLLSFDPDIEVIAMGRKRQDRFRALVQLARMSCSWISTSLNGWDHSHQ
jgi:chemotaxis response regulator CheB